MKTFAWFAGNTTCLALVFTLSFAAQSPAAEKSEINVGFFTLWGGAAGVTPDGFVDSLDAWPGLSARLVTVANEGDSWRSVPEQIDPGAWISLVGIHVRDGRQCDFLVFAFADRQGTVGYAGRRPSRVPMQPPNYWYSVPPGPNQLPRNAIVETATDYLFRHAAAASSKRPTIRIAAKPWSSESAEKGKANDEISARSLPAEVVESLCFAAAFEAGWRPTANAEAETILDVSMADFANVFVSVKADIANGQRGFARNNIPSESLYNHLVTLFRKHLDSKRILNGCAYWGDDARLLGWVNGRLILANGDDFKAIDPVSGRTSWQIKAMPRNKPEVDILKIGNAEQLIVCSDNQYRLVGADSAKESILASDAEFKNRAGACALASDDRFALVDANRLLVFHDNTQIWAWAGAALDTKPVWTETGLVLMGADGEIHAFDPGSKSELWHQNLPASQPIALFTPGSLLLADTGAELFSLDPATGKILWKAETGDVLIAPPVIMDNNLFAAIKPNRLRVFDVASGSQQASRDWPSWILAALPARASGGWKVGCVDLQHRFSVLNVQKLEDDFQLQFPRSLASFLAFGENIPTAWSPARSEKSEGVIEDFISDLADANIAMPLKPAWLLADQSGCVYAISAE